MCLCETKTETYDVETYKESTITILFFWVNARHGLCDKDLFFIFFLGEFGQVVD